ncbi:MAG: protein-export chaperone SecB [Gammaproteobacteria bacterium]|nr:protein-export chaperone SecB [Gammaproteobacteria bacterium]
MSDSNQKASNSARQQQFVMQKIYVKDVSFETPNTPEVFTQEWKPDVNVELDTKGKQIAPDVHEVVLGVTVTVKMGDKVAYLIEIHQAGIFTIKGFADGDRGAMLGSYCPNVLFPFAREAISDLVTKGGFPQLLLAPVNFDAIYHEHLQRIRAQSSEQKNAGEKAVH